jgi:uncharacterized membrane protein
MPDQQRDELLERISKLEDRVEQLEQKLHAGSPRSGTSAPASRPQEKLGINRAQDRIENLQFNEQWLNRIGIGLLLIGVVFLFKYSVDQGWLIPPVRSAIGLGLGGLLFGFGLQMNERMGVFRQLMLGGGIAIFYITGFATFQLYAFVPHLLIWAFMVTVTLLALSLSLQQDEAVLSVTGTLGALGTPFMLYSGSGSTGMLVMYTTLVLAAAAVIYYRKGWTSLLWSMLVGGFGVMGVGVLSSEFDSQSLSLLDHWWLQAGMTFWALSTWGVAVLRVLITKPPEMSSSTPIAVFWVPFWLLPLTAMHWDLSTEAGAMVAFGLAVIGGLGYYFLYREKVPRLAFSHGFMALIMSTIGLVLLFEGTMLFVLLAAEAIVLRYISAETGDARLNISAHFLFVVDVVWVANSLYWTVESTMSIKAFTQLLFVIAGGTLIPSWLKRADFKKLYRILCHLLLLYWIYQTVASFSNGQAWVTVLWGSYAIGLLIAGFIRYGKKVRLMGMGTIFLVIGKLFLVDLATLPAIWRILLFIGFGGALILLGYYLQSRWSRSKSEA